MSFGKIYNPEISRAELFEVFYQIFYKLIGDHGNMSFPSFSYSWRYDQKYKVFDKLNTPGKVRVLTDFIGKRVNSFRTNDSPKHNDQVLSFNAKIFERL